MIIIINYVWETCAEVGVGKQSHSKHGQFIEILLWTISAFCHCKIRFHWFIFKVANYLDVIFGFVLLLI